MITTSAEYKTEVWTNDNRQFLHYAVVTLTDGTVINLDNTNIWQGGFRLEEAVSSSSAMEVGACIASELTLIINNINGIYDGIDFEGASVVASIGLMVNGSEERFLRCTAHVDEMETTGSLITLICLDAMVMFDRPYSESSLTYPATLGQIVADACTVCGVPLATPTFNNSDFVISKRPDDESLTFREVLSCALQIACSWGKINPYGALEIGSYSLGISKTATWDDVGALTWNALGNFTWNVLPYPTGDSFDGGTFWVDEDSFDGGTFWTDADTFDGGQFFNQPDMDFDVRGYNSFKVDFRKCTFTGVEVTANDVTALAGNDTYVVKVENNVLVEDARIVASLMLPYIEGLTFWPYEAEHLSDPSMQAGDTVLLYDRKGNEYRTFATNVTYSAGNYQSTGCYAESYPKNESTRYTAAARTEARAVSKASTYVDLLANSFGLYRSEIPDPVIQGAYTYALHNGATYDTSTFAMIANAEGLFMQSRSSASDEWTTTASVASDGDALVNVLSAVGIKADWVKIGGSDADGTLYIYDASDNVIGEWGADGIKIYEGAIQMTALDPTEDVISLERETRSGTYTTTIKSTVGAGYFLAESDGVDGNYVERYTQSVSNEMFHSLYRYAEDGSGTYHSVEMFSENLEIERGTYSTDGGEDEVFRMTDYCYVTPDGVDTSGTGEFAGDVSVGGKLTVTGNGVEISYTTPFIDFHFNRSTADYTARIIERSSGALTAYSSITSASDKRWKDIQDEDIPDVSGIRTVRYKWNKGSPVHEYERIHTGYIAQEVQEVAPEYVFEDEDGYLELNYNEVLVAKIACLEKRCADLEERLSALEARCLDDGR